MTGFANRSFQPLVRSSARGGVRGPVFPVAGGPCVHERPLVTEGRGAGAVQRTRRSGARPGAEQEGADGAADGRGRGAPSPSSGGAHALTDLGPPAGTAGLLRPSDTGTFRRPCLAKAPPFQNHIPRTSRVSAWQGVFVHTSSPTPFAPLAVPSCPRTLSFRERRPLPHARAQAAGPWAAGPRAAGRASASDRR